MTEAETVNSIVNNISTKLGFAAAQVAQVGQTLVHETATRGLVVACTFGGIALLFLLLFLAGVIVGVKEETPSDGACATVLTGLVGLIIASIISFVFLMDWVAPTTATLNNLLGR